MYLADTSDDDFSNGFIDFKMYLIDGLICLSFTSITKLTSGWSIKIYYPYLTYNEIVSSSYLSGLSYPSPLS